MNEKSAISTPKSDPAREFYSGWQQLPNKIFFFTLLIAWLALFQFLGNSTFGYSHGSSLFGWMLMAYNGQGVSGDTLMGI